MKKIICILALISVIFALSACSENNSETQNNTTEDTAISTTSEAIQDDALSDEDVEPETILYIGTDDSSFAEYSVHIEGEVTAEKLIDEIETLTGWNLDLADGVTSGKGGMTVCFANTSSLFVGPPEPQKDEFFMYDMESLAHTILDSVKKTLQENFVMSSGNPDSLGIYYCMEGDQPLEISSIDKSWSLEEAYEW